MEESFWDKKKLFRMLCNFFLSVRYRENKISDRALAVVDDKIRPMTKPCDVPQSMEARQSRNTTEVMSMEGRFLNGS